MSINSALLAGVSGLISNSSALAALSDNISNVNTVAYKRNQVNFANVVTAQAVQGRYSAGGVQAVTRQYVAQQGLIQTSNSATDLAIAGEGFFVVADRSNPAANEARKFTRSGSFNVDLEGFMVNDSGHYLQGWKYEVTPANPDGFDVNPSDLRGLESINVKTLGAAVAPTTAIAITANLDKNTTARTYADGEMTNYFEDSTAVGALQPHFEIELNVIDSQGGTRKLVMAFNKSDTVPNQWDTEIYAAPLSDIEGGASDALTGPNSFVMFNSDGTIDLATSNLFGTVDLTVQANRTLTIDASVDTTGWEVDLGLAETEIEFDLSKITQYASTSTVQSINSDGAGVGNVIGINVDDDGVVTATYDNNQVRTLAKIGLATFPNVNALTKVSGNAYIGSVNAGVMVIKEPNVGGAGGIAAASLEASTVDLSSEFTGLIQTQKAYSASSKIITTADQMLEELINIKR
jgi:flagellar hook protein FlgE